MLMSIFSPISRTLCSNSRRIFTARRINPQMGGEDLSFIEKRKRANLRLINVSGFKTDLLEIRAPKPTLHVLLIPGNPGIISFYIDFLESLYELLGGSASVTAIGHIAHSEKNWESPRLFSLQEQINHKLSFIEQELEDAEVPIVLVGHSIGSYISLEIFKKIQQKVIYCIGLYPFLALNTASSTQSSIRRLAMCPALCAAVSSLGASVGMLPAQISRFIVKKSIGKTWSSSAVEVLHTHFLKYHTIRNVFFMAKTEFEKKYQIGISSEERKAKLRFCLASMITGVLCIYMKRLASKYLELLWRSNARAILMHSVALRLDQYGLLSMSQV